MPINPITSYTDLVNQCHRTVEPNAYAIAYAEDVDGLPDGTSRIEALRHLNVLTQNDPEYEALFVAGFNRFALRIKEADLAERRRRVCLDVMKMTDRKRESQQKGRTMTAKLRNDKTSAAKREPKAKKGKTSLKARKAPKGDDDGAAAPVESQAAETVTSTSQENSPADSAPAPADQTEAAAKLKKLKGKQPKTKAVLRKGKPTKFRTATATGAKDKRTGKKPFKARIRPSKFDKKLKAKKSKVKKTKGPGKGGHKHFGLVDKSRTGMSISRFWCYLFANNERMYASAKDRSKVLTDPEITQTLLAAYPGRKADYFHDVQSIRRRYCGGEFDGKGHVSYRYLRLKEGKMVRESCVPNDRMKALEDKYGKEPPATYKHKAKSPVDIPAQIG